MARSVKSRTRTAYTISTISVTLVLFIVGVAAYLLYGATLVTDSMLNNVKVSLMLKDGVSSENVDALKKELSDKEYVSHVDYISKAQAVEDFNKYIGEDFVLNLGENPLPASLEVFIKSGNSDMAVKSITKIAGDNGDVVEEVVHQGAIMQQTIHNITLFKVVVLAFLIALILVSVITINNTIRMAVLSRRFLIKTMLLVGATHGFIRRPFLAKAFWQGVLSAFIAILLIVALVFSVNRMIPELTLPYTNIISLIAIPVFLIMLGALICVTSTAMAVNRYMNLHTNELYIY